LPVALTAAVSALAAAFSVLASAFTVSALAPAAAVVLALWHRQQLWLLQPCFSLGGLSVGLGLGFGGFRIGSGLGFFSLCIGSNDFGVGLDVYLGFSLDGLASDFSALASLSPQPVRQLVRIRSWQTGLLRVRRSTCS